MLITRTSIASGITRERDLDITDEQIKAYESGVHVQVAFPQLSASEREFFISGVTDEEWDSIMGEDE